MNILLKYLIIIGWMIIIFHLSSEVASTSSGRSDAIVATLSNFLNIHLPEDFLTFITRKAAHAIAYLILGILAYSIFKTYKVSRKKAILFSTTFAFIYAISDEFHQLFIPGRSGEIRDVIIDTTAAALGVYFYHFISNKRQNSINSKKDV